MARDIRIRGLKEKLDDNALEQDDIKEAVALGVLTAEQAVEMGFDVSVEENAEETVIPQDGDALAFETAGEEVTTDETPSDDSSTNDLKF